MTRPVRAIFPHSEPWDFVPSAAKNLLSSRGLKKTHFTASMLTLQSSKALPYAVFELKTTGEEQKRLGAFDLKQLDSYGLRSFVSHGKLRFIFDMDDRL